ncbi:MAG: DUF547 domain-containing protein [Spirochaetota bacterium]
MIAYTSKGRRSTAGLRWRRHRLLLAALLMIVPLTGLVAAPQAELGPRWEAHDPDSTRTLDHGDWGTFLDRYLVTDDPSGVNLVPYGDVTESDRGLLTGYLNYLQDVPVSELNRDEQLAYWINLYNAATIELILDNYPVDSIRDIKPNIFASGPWDMEFLEVEGESVSLNDVEHRIIRPVWQDNRIHYVVNCASIGCPNLYPEPLTALNGDRVFDESVVSYTNHPRGVRFDGGQLVLSEIYNWYVSDFEGTVEGVIEHLIEYVPGPTSRRLRAFTGRPRYEYDWSLNQP